MFFSGIADESGRPIETQIRAHQELGWDHIEIRNVNATTLAYADDEEFDSIRGKLGEAGIQVSCFASKLANWARDIKAPLAEDIDELRRSIPRMHKLNTPFIRIMTWANKSKVSEAEWRKDGLARMKEIVKIAEDDGVTLVHENCDGWAGLSPENTLELLAEVDSPALKLVYDTGNPVGHAQDPWDFYTKVRPHIVYVHIKDGTLTADEKAIYSWPGEGDGRVLDVLSDLFKTGYDGGVSIEPHLKMVVHEGKDASPEEKYTSYIRYGKLLMELVEKTKPA